MLSLAQLVACAPYEPVVHELKSGCAQSRATVHQEVVHMEADCRSTVLWYVVPRLPYTLLTPL